MKKALICLLVLSTFGVEIANAQTEVTFYTTMGDFEVKLYDSVVPITAGNFIDLVEQGYYDGVIFHRVIDKFMIQGGDPTGTGTGGPGYAIQDEFDSSLSNIQKTISMANSGPNTGGSQFFINLVNNTYLDFDKPPFTSKHPVFGIVISNFTVVQAIGKVATNSQNRPLTDVVMDSIRVTYVKQPTSIAKAQYEAPGIALYPNPASNPNNLSLASKVEGRFDISVYNSVGSLIFNTQENITKGVNKLNISNAALSQGVYYITITDGSKLMLRDKLLVVE